VKKVGRKRKVCTEYCKQRREQKESEIGARGEGMRWYSMSDVNMQMGIKVEMVVWGAVW